jgi:hypothetical protein
MRSHVHWMRCLACACAGFFAEEHCEDITIRGGTFTEIGYLCNETVPSSAADVPSEQVNTYRAVGNTFCEGPGAGYVFNTGSLRPRAGAACVAFHRTGNRVGLAVGPQPRGCLPPSWDPSRQTCCWEQGDLCSQPTGRGAPRSAVHHPTLGAPALQLTLVYSRGIDATSFDTRTVGESCPAVDFAESSLALGTPLNVLTLVEGGQPSSSFTCT